MCGRTCMTLQPEEIIRHCTCSFKNKDAKGVKWVQNFGKAYCKSYNISPSMITPVLLSSKCFASNEESERIIIPMKWGLIPFWLKDNNKGCFKTNNCRLESMLQSKLYKGLFRKGQRCVMLCEGFYEWQTTKSEKKVYFVFVPQENDVKIYDKSTWKDQNINLLKIAGLYDVWEDNTGEKVYSFTIITYESNNKLSWLHHRTPAILDTDEQVSDWIDFNRVTDEQALAALQHPKKLEWFEVSKIVNNTRNQTDECNKPIKLFSGKKSITTKSKIMQSWLTIGKRKAENIKLESDDDIKEEIKKTPKKYKQGDY